MIELYGYILGISLVVQWIRICLPRQKMKKMWFQSLDQEDPLEEGMATHSSILTWEIPWTEETDGLQSMGSQSLTQLKRPSRWTQFGGTWRNQRQNL